MNVQTHHSGQISGQVANQAGAMLPGLPQQNGNPVPNQMQNPSIHRNVLSMDPETVKARRNMQEKIWEFLVQRRRQTHEVPTKKMVDLVKRLEEGLFKNATTKEEYENMATLEKRLHLLVKIPVMRNQNQEFSSANSSPSIGTMIPTPGFQQTGSSNLTATSSVALNTLEIAATTSSAQADKNLEAPVSISLDDVKEALQCKHLAYDRAGEEHCNLISALHKSMRGSDANAAIYWLARMVEGGEQPLYIARRLIRFASEDIGLADPQALTQAVSCYQACHLMGMPESNVVLAQCVAYLALAPKSAAVYRAMESAQKVVRESVGQNEGVPLHLRNAPTELMKDLGYGKGYIYPPDNPNSSSQTYMPPSLQGYKFLHWP